MITPIVFILITLAAIGLFFWATEKSQLVLVFLVIWGIITGVLAYAGFYQKLNVIPPRIVFVLVPVTIYMIYFYRKLNISKTKTNYLLAIHGLRLPVELVLFSLFNQGKIPKVMTFEGLNFDILMGITAIALLIYTVVTKKQLSQKLLRIWNIAGILLLANIVIIAILSVPLPIQQFGFKQPNMGVLAFPYTWLPAIVVPVVFLSHFLGLKALKQSA